MMHCVTSPTLTRTAENDGLQRVTRNERENEMTKQPEEKAQFIPQLKRMFSPTLELTLVHSEVYPLSYNVLLRVILAIYY